LALAFGRRLYHTPYITSLPPWTTSLSASLKVGYSCLNSAMSTQEVLTAGWPAHRTTTSVRPRARQLLVASSGSRQARPCRIGGKVSGPVGSSPQYFFSSLTWKTSWRRAPAGSCSWQATTPTRATILNGLKDRAAVLGGQRGH
jgi:hypothetical protein